MAIRPFRAEDASALARLSASCLRGESDFVLNPLWETEDELRIEFARRGIEPEENLLVADVGDGEVVGVSGFLRAPKDTMGGLICPIVDRSQRGRGVGGELLRAALDLGANALGLRLATAGIGTRNRAGYALLTALGFRPVRQHFLMRSDQKPEPERRGPKGLELVPATAGDVEAILEIYTACGFEARTVTRMQELFDDGRHLHVIARQEGRVVGFAEIETHWPRRVWLAFVGVCPELRDRGVGSALVSFSLAKLFDDGAESALLLLSPANRTALRAYEKVGFRRARLVDVLAKNL